ncbi:MAG: histidine phosphatase family protein [Betaproteobacteria bacterium]
MKSALYSLALAAAAGLGVPAHALSPALQGVPPPAPGRSSLPAKSMPAGELVSELRTGGYILYFRHTSTDFSRDDTRSQSDEDCENQRLLNERGRREARDIGAFIKALGIPIGRVLASPRCRTLETAMLAFGRAEKAGAVRGGPARPQHEDRYAGLRQLLRAPIKPGANLVISSHGNPFFAVAGTPYLAEGECAVVRPLGTDFEVVARIRIEDWEGLRNTARPAAAGSHKMRSVIRTINPLEITP